MEFYGGSGSKKDPGWRLCIDYRRLDSVSRQNVYPLPQIDALTARVYFSPLDLLSGYWLAILGRKAQEKVTFVTQGGLWTWAVLHFGFTSALATFEFLMEWVLKGSQLKLLLLYLEDMIVFLSEFSSHVERLKEVLQRFRTAGLKLKPSKCDVFQKGVSYLGHVISEQDASTDLNLQ